MRIHVLAAFTFLALAVSSLADALTFVPDTQENEVVAVSAGTIFFFGHSTDFWDGENTGPAVREMIRIADSKGIYKIATISDVMLEGNVAEQHYFRPGEIDLLVPSRAGQHSLQFPNAKAIYVLGGNMGRCLCEGVRDIARGWWSSSTSKTLNIFMVIEGLYDAYPLFSPMTKTSAPEFTKNFYGGSFNCPLQNWLNKPRVPLTNTKLSLKFKGEQLLELDLEPGDSQPLGTLERTINVHYIGLDQVPGTL